MAERTLIARVREDDVHPGTLLVTSPVVGVVDGPPSAGVFLNRYDPILAVRIMGRRHILRMPRDQHGWVVDVRIPNQLTPVAFDAPLLRIDPRIAGIEEAAGVAHAGKVGGTDEEAGDAIVIKSPTEGIFYRRPTPDAPSFVDVGARVVVGTVLGLVEVMKCFNQITYGGPGLPEDGIVSRVLVEDATDVHFGQPLFWIRPGK